MKRPVLLIDGLNLFMRHFVVNPTIDDSGNHVGGVVGFLKSLGYLVTRVNPSRIIIAWEGGGSSRRRAIFKNYKNNRRPQKLNRYYGDQIPDTVENRNSQIAKIVSILRSVPVDQIYIDNCEADDIIGYIVKNKIDQRSVIASSDKDLYQLLSKKTIQWSPGQKKFITIKDLVDKFGISAVNFCTARSFIGDSSDGVDGVKLAGFKSLSKRFPELTSNNFFSVQDVFDSCEKLDDKSRLKIHKNIIESIDIAKRNWKLMYLDITNLSAEQIKKIDFYLENQCKSANKMQLLKSISKLGIRNFDVDTFYSSMTSIRKNNV